MAKTIKYTAKFKPGDIIICIKDYRFTLDWFSDDQEAFKTAPSFLSVGHKLEVLYPWTQGYYTLATKSEMHLKILHTNFNYEVDGTFNLPPETVDECFILESEYRQLINPIINKSRFELLEE